MNCSDFEKLIALYAEEDLSALEGGWVEAHLRECSLCWDLAEDLKESQAVFKSIRQDVPNAAALSVLRERVLSEVSGRGTMTWFERLVFGGLRRKSALAAIALVVVSSGVFWLTRTPLVIPVASIPVAVNRAPSTIVERVVSESRPVPAAPRRAPKRVRRAAPEPPPDPAVEEPKQVAIKFVTDDPNIIIYWLVDEKGD